jgi:hypothetical protein
VNDDATQTFTLKFLTMEFYILLLQSSSSAVTMNDTIKYIYKRMDSLCKVHLKILRTYSNILKFHNYEFEIPRKYERDYYPDYSNRNELYCLFERLNEKEDPEWYVVPAVAHAGSLTRHLECGFPEQICNKMKIDREQDRMVLVELYTSVPDIIRWTMSILPHRRNLHGGTPSLNQKHSSRHSMTLFLSIGSGIQ